MRGHEALDPEIRDHLLRVVDLSARDLDKVVGELLDHWSETMEDFVRRRHGALQKQGVPNRSAYGQIAHELSCRRVRAPRLSERQIRRIIYG